MAELQSLEAMLATARQLTAELTASLDTQTRLNDSLLSEKLWSMTDVAAYIQCGDSAARDWLKENVEFVENCPGHKRWEPAKVKAALGIRQAVEDSS